MNANEVELFSNTIIDTTILHAMMGKWEYSNDKFPSILNKTSDSSSFVIRIGKKMKGYEDEISVFLFGEWYNKKLIRLYVIEVGQNQANWRMIESGFIIRYDDDNNRIELSAIMKEIGFACPFSISFQYNDQGHYDYDYERYMIIECEFNANDSMVNQYPDRTDYFD